MRIRRIIARSCYFGCAVVAVALLSRCGGKGGGSGGMGSAPIPTGSVSVLLADGPSLKFDHVWVDIAQIELLPAGNGDPVIVFEGKETVDLLKFQGEDFVLASGRSVPAGTYQKIRLEISGIRVEPALCNEMKLPSGKIDLNPRGSFEVAKDQSIVVRIDIDAQKSISIHEAGKSGKCIFRPVVFVDVLEGSPALCRQEIAGTIVGLFDPQHDPQEFPLPVHHDHGHDKQSPAPATIAILQVDLGSDRGVVRVAVEAETAIFDSKALPAALADLNLGDLVRARGLMGADGRLAATWVIDGQPEDLRGTFAGPIADGKFTFAASGAVNCRTSSATKAYGPCDDPVSLDSIRTGQSARLLGASDSQDGATFLRVAVIDLGTFEVRGEISSIDGTTGAVTVHPPVGDNVTFQLTAATEFVLVGDGSLTAEDLRPGETITAQLDPVTLDAARIAVDPEEIPGKVSSFNASARTFTLTPDPPATAATVTVFPNATVLLIQGANESSLVDLSELANGDEATVFGLIPAAGTFDARVVLIRR